MGPSGSGKSTLALALAGLVPRELPATMDGELEVDGRDIRTLTAGEATARVGVVFQDPASQLVMDRVEDDVAFGLENRGWSRRRCTTGSQSPWPRWASTDRSVDGRGTCPAGSSNGWRWPARWRRQPGLLVLDEPTANLDPDGAAALLAELRALRDRRAATVVLIEHRVEDAWPLADVVVALDGIGRPIDVGPRDEVAARSGKRMAAAGIWLPAGVDPACGGGPRSRR